LLQILFDSHLIGTTAFASHKAVQDAGDIGPVPVQQFSGIRRLRLAHAIRVQVENSDTGQAVENGPEDFQASRRESWTFGVIPAQREIDGHKLKGGGNVKFRCVARLPSAQDAFVSLSLGQPLTQRRSQSVGNSAWPIYVLLTGEVKTG
jgi:hypothetical protein